MADKQECKRSQAGGQLCAMRSAMPLPLPKDVNFEEFNSIKFSSMQHQLYLTALLL